MVVLAAIGVDNFMEMMERLVAVAPAGDDDTKKGASIRTIPLRKPTYRARHLAIVIATTVLERSQRGSLYEFFPYCVA